MCVGFDVTTRNEPCVNNPPRAVVRQLDAHLVALDVVDSIMLANASFKNV
jgi:hypothetical protein